MANRVQIIFDALNRMDGTVREVETEIKGVSSAAAGAKTALVGMGAILGGLGLKEVAVDVWEAGAAWQGMESAMLAATGSARAAGAELDFARAESRRLGLDLRVAAGGLSQLSAAAKGTSITGRDLREIFLGIGEASTVLNLSSADSEGALRAIVQIMSKGTVQAEELRGQLGERIPGAFNIAARAMGVSTAELNKMLEQGQVLSDEFLPKFAAELRRTYADALPDALEKARAESNRLKTAWFELAQAVADTGFMEAANDGIRALTESMDRLRRAIKETNQETLARLQSELQHVTEQLTAAQGPNAAFAWAYGGIDNLETKAQKLREAIAALKAEMGVDQRSLDLRADDVDSAPGDPNAGLKVEVETAAQRRAREKAEDDADRRRHELRLAAMEAENRQREEVERAQVEYLRRLADEEDAADARSFANRMASMAAENQARQEREAAIVAGLRREKEEADAAFEQVSEFGIQAARNIQDAFADFLFDPFEDGLDGMLQKFGDTLRRMWAEATANQLLTGVFNSMAGAQSGVWSSIGRFFGGTPTIKHDGGPIIPRFHFGGLLPDEVPAILQTGERVLSRQQNRTFDKLAALLEGGGGGAAGVEVNVINNAEGTRAATSERNQGGKRIVDVIIETVEGGISSGRLDRAMGSNYGVTRAGVRR